MSICPKDVAAIPQRHRDEKWQLVTVVGLITFVIAGNTRREHGGGAGERVHTLIATQTIRQPPPPPPRPRQHRYTFTKPSRMEGQESHPGRSTTRE